MSSFTLSSYNKRSLQLVLLVGLAAFAQPASLQAREITAASCARDHVNSAVSSASDGDTVIIPPGTCVWSSGVIISGKGIRLMAAVKGSVTLEHNAVGSLIQIHRDDSHVNRISNLVFVEGATTDGEAVHVHVFGPPPPATGYLPVIIDSNEFHSDGTLARSILVQMVGGSIIAGNTFDDHLKTDQGIGFKTETASSDVSWTTPATYGATDITGLANNYVEDNTFITYMLAGALDIDSNARVVVRHNVFQNSYISSHGADTSQDGVRHVEVYDNTFLFQQLEDNSWPNLNWFFYMRGGSWVIADNVVPDIISSSWGNKGEMKMTVQNLRRKSGPYPCWNSGWPAPHQIGQGHDGVTNIVEGVYIWGNTGSGNMTTAGLQNYSPDQCGGPDITEYIKPGRDYFNVPKPGYKKYTYPHPHRLTPPQNLRIAQ